MDAQTQLMRNVAAQRRSMGWTQAELAATPGWTPARVSSVETGRTRVDVGDLFELREALQVPLVRLCGRSNDHDRTMPGL